MTLTAARVRQIVESRWFGAYPNRAAEELLALTDPSLPDMLRAFVDRYFLEGSPRGFNLRELADQIEQVEGNPRLEVDGSTSWAEFPLVSPENETP